MNKGISLIVLVITIIVMIILAGSIVLTLNNNGITDRANEAVEESNLNEIRSLAAIAWADAYLKHGADQSELEIAVMDALKANGITEQDYLGYTLVVTKEGAELVANHNGTVIPKGATYYVGVTSTTEGDYTGATTTYTAGDKFPSNVNTGDVYVYEDYEYRYNQSCEYVDIIVEGTEEIAFGTWKTVDTQNGWGVRALGSKKSTYGLVLHSINKQPITSMSSTFEYSDVVALNEDFTIPSTVTNIRHMFVDTINLKTLPDKLTFPYGIEDMCELFYGSGIITLPENLSIPNSVKDMSFMFCYCTSLESIPSNFKIPNSVKDIRALFSDCTSLKELPDGFVIPDGITNIGGMFLGCTSLEKLPGDFKIPNSVIDINGMFSGCTKLATLPENFVIPSKVSCMTWAFQGCENLTGTITINANPTEYEECFEGTEKQIFITGTSTIDTKNKLAETANNGNVTIK